MPERLVLQFAGDISLNQDLGEPATRPVLERSLDRLSRRLGPCDLRIANWESPLADGEGFNPLTNPQVWTTLEAAEAVAAFDLDVALLANNHSYDRLEGGFERTVGFLDRHGVMTLGAGRDESEARRPLIVERRGIRIGLLNYVGDETHPLIPKGAGGSVNRLDPGRMLVDVAALAREADVVVVNLHWGEVFTRFPALSQRRLARRAVEAGATVVVGHHAHRLQGFERWRQGCIFYSLGNFAFGRVDGRPWPVVSRRSGVAECVVSSDGVGAARIVPLLQTGARVELDDRAYRRRLQRALNVPLGWPDGVYRMIRKAELLYQWGPGAVARFLARSGGLRNAARRLSWNHVRAAVMVLAKGAN